MDEMGSSVSTPLTPRRSLIDGLLCNRGTIAIKAALALPLLVFLVGNTTDYARFLKERTALQDAVDAASLAAAKEVSLTDSNRDSLAAVARSIVQRYVDIHKQALSDDDVKIDVSTRSSPLEVDVQAALPFTAIFGNVFGFNPDKVNVRSVARVVGKPNICLLALDGWGPGAVQLEVSAKMTARNCGVYSNSRSPAGVSILNAARLTADVTCSAGGVVGGRKIAPAAYTDCPQFDDPLAGRPEPTPGACDHTATIVVAQRRHLRPGTYCLGLTIAGLADVTFEPGIYYIKGGLFSVAGLAKIKGDGVSFYLGPTATLLFDPTTTIKLSATRSGPLAGLLFFASRSQPKLLTHTILSRNAQELTGTVYLPTSTLVVDGSARIGAEAAYTAIVARRILLLATPHVVLNSNFDETDVPVPDGIRGAGQPVILAK